MTNMPNVRGTQVALSVAIAIGLIAGAAGFGGGLLTAGGQFGSVSAALVGENAPRDVDMGAVWKAWRIIDERFVPASVATSTDEDGEEPTEEEKRVYGMIAGLAESLGDPYTYFLPPAEKTQFEDDMSGAFEGVGMEIAVRDEQLTVVSPLKNSPAERAGIKAGDRVEKIGDLDTHGIDINTAVKNIRGPKGSSVTLLIAREGWVEPREFTVERDVINVPIVTAELRPDGIFVIEVASFTANAPGLFRDGLRTFIESGSNKLILDLRGNPGGFLDAAVDMASWFLPTGRIVVSEDYAGHQENIEHRSRGYNVFNDNLKMVILVDKGSASASEILALALKSYGKATLVGATTFGKGSVQELVDITSNTSLKLTVARWVGPNGEQIPHTGIVPDVEVEMTDDDRTAGEDPQMDRAVEILLSK